MVRQCRDGTCKSGTGVVVSFASRNRFRSAVNVLIEGTTFMDMFDPAGYYLFGENELPEAFADWMTEYLKFESFPAPKDTLKRFCTLVVRRPK